MKGGLGDWVGRPFRARGLMGVPLTQAVGLGFVRSPLWGSRTWASLGRPFGDQRPRRTLPDLGSSALHFISHSNAARNPLQPGAKQFTLPVYGLHVEAPLALGTS